MSRRRASDSTYVVTGCAGFIGSHLVDALLDRGHAVLGIDSFSDFYPRRIKEANLANAKRRPAFRLIEADLATSLLAPLLAEADGVFHLAAQPGVRESWGPGFSSYVHHNVLATQKVLEAAVAAGVRIALASSSSVYGEARIHPTPETAGCRPLSPYGVTKLTCEKLAAAYSSQCDADVVVLRYFTVYGPRQRPDMAFTRVLRSLLAGDCFEIHGSGRQARDVTYIEDAVAATVIALERGARDGVYNVGGGHIISLLGVIEVCERLAGRRLRIEHIEAAAGDVLLTTADTSRLARLGWRPRTTLEEGLHAQLEWVMQSSAEAGP